MKECWRGYGTRHKYNTNAQPTWTEKPDGRTDSLRRIAVFEWEPDRYRPVSKFRSGVLTDGLSREGIIVASSLARDLGNGDGEAGNEGLTALE